MALIPCKECSTQVSDQAFKCPSCGAQLRKPKRSLFGKLCLWSFILFNLYMAGTMINGVRSSAADIATLSGAQQAGAVLGTGIGFSVVLALWVAGDIILGLFTLFTRPRAS